jgi:hypothetical protein
VPARRSCPGSDAVPVPVVATRAATPCRRAATGPVGTWEPVEGLVAGTGLPRRRPRSGKSPIWDIGGKLSQTSTNFQVKRGESASIMGIDDSLPGNAAPHLEFFD